MAFALIFILISEKFFVFVDAHGVRDYEDTIDISLYFMQISYYYHCQLVALNIKAPNTLNIVNID